MSTPADESSSSIGWPRAILTAAIIVAVGVAVCVYGANAALTKIHSGNRGNRVALATVIFFAGLFVVAAALRVLQRRKLM